MKRCTACGETKPVGEFSMEKRGRCKSRCKTCRAAAGRTEKGRAWGRAYRVRNRGRYREKQRAYEMRNRGRRRERDAATRKTAKCRARMAVRDAVHRGRLAKPSRCQECGDTPSRQRLHGHHHRGYEFPLDVVWLCSICHGHAHWLREEAA